MTEFIANVVDKKIPEGKRRLIAHAIAMHDGHAVTITVKRYRDSITNAQRGYWWAVVVRNVAENCGYTTDEAHDELLWHLLPEKRVEYKRLSGEKATRRVSLKDLDTSETANLLERAWRFAAEVLSLYIPSPGEYMQNTTSKGCENDDKLA